MKKVDISSLEQALADVQSLGVDNISREYLRQLGYGAQFHTGTLHKNYGDVSVIYQESQSGLYSFQGLLRHNLPPKIDRSYRGCD
jgi:hypothetical protein